MGIFQQTDAFLHRQNPWYALVLFLISVVLNVFLFFAAQDEGSIAFGSASLKIYDQAESFDAITVITRDDEKIEGKVYAVETRIANTGDISLSSDRKRRPIVLSFGRDAKIIDSRVSAATDADITKFKLRPVTEPNKPQALEILWNHFDPGHTVKITTIVSTSGEIHPVVAGHYLGVAIVSGTLEKPAVQEKKYGLPKWLIGVTAIIVLFIAMGLFLTLVEKILKYSFPKKTSKELSHIVANTFGLLFIALVIASFSYYYFTRVTVPYIP